jgi:hypothetical protein
LEIFGAIMSENYRPTYNVNLFKEELLLLDGKSSPKVQEIIDKIKDQSTFGFDLDLINKVLQDSLKKGQFSFSIREMTSCNYCNKKAQYYFHARDSRKRFGGYRKGDPNYDAPKYYTGVRFNEGFINFKGYCDICTDCEKRLKIINTIENYIIDNDLKIEIVKNPKSKYVKDVIRKCWKCKKEMQESEMGKRPTLMGNGYYPSVCPHCKAESLLLNTHEVTKKFVMLPIINKG